MSEEEQKTIDFLVNKVKQLELDVQYELHLREELQAKYDTLHNNYERLKRSLEEWQKKFNRFVMTVKTL